MSTDRWLSLTHDRDDGWIVQPHPTREAAEARVAEWLEECGVWAATQGDGWPEEMDAYVVSIAAALRETSWEDEETGEPFAEYRMETVPDARDAHIAELEAEVARLRALVPHPCPATPVGAQDAPAGERQPTPEPPRDPRHITAESERVPSHESEDAHLMPPAWLEEPGSPEHEQKAAAVSAAAQRVRDASQRMSAGEDAAPEFTAALAALSRLLGEVWTCIDCDTDYTPVGDAPRCPKCHPSPTHEDIDAHPDPVRMAERVMKLKWRASDIFLGDHFLDAPGVAPWAISSPDTGWCVFQAHREDVGDCVASGPGEDRPAASRAALHAYLEGRLTPPEGAPGWGAWEWER